MNHYLISLLSMLAAVSVLTLGLVPYLDAAPAPVHEILIESPFERPVEYSSSVGIEHLETGRVHSLHGCGMICIPAINTLAAGRSLRMSWNTGEECEPPADGNYRPYVWLIEGGRLYGETFSHHMPGAVRGIRGPYHTLD